MSTNNSSSSSSVKNGIIPSPPKVKKGVKLPPLSMPPPPYSRLLSCPAYNEEDNLATPGTPGPGSKTFDWSGFVAAAAAAERPVAAPGNSPPPPPGRPEASNNVDGVVDGVSGEVAACEKKSTADVDKIADALADIEQVTTTTTTTSASDQSEDVDDDDNKYNSYTPTAPPASPGGEDASSSAAGDSNVD